MSSKNKKKMQQEENVITGMKNCNICMKRTISIDIWGRKKSDVSFINIQNPIITNTTQSQISDALGFALKVWKNKQTIHGIKITAYMYSTCMVSITIYIYSNFMRLWKYLCTT